MYTLIFIDSKRSLVEKSFFEILILFNYVQYIFKNVKRDFFKSMYFSSLGQIGGWVVFPWLQCGTEWYWPVWYEHNGTPEVKVFDKKRWRVHVHDPGGQNGTSKRISSEASGQPQVQVFMVLGVCPWVKRKVVRILWQYRSSSCITWGQVSSHDECF